MVVNFMIYWKKTEYPKKTTNLPEITDSYLYHIMLYRVHLVTAVRRTHYFSSDKRRLHRQMLIQQPYDLA